MPHLIKTWHILSFPASLSIRKYKDASHLTKTFYYFRVLCFFSKLVLSLLVTLSIRKWRDASHLTKTHYIYCFSFLLFLWSKLVFSLPVTPSVQKYKDVSHLIKTPYILDDGWSAIYKSARLLTCNYYFSYNLVLFFLFGVPNKFSVYLLVLYKITQLLTAYRFILA